MNTKLLILSILLSISEVSAATKGVNTSGSDVLWIVLTVVLTLLFARSGFIKSLILNPAFLLLVIILIVATYILLAAINIAFGVGDYVDNKISNVVDIISTLRG